jgi:hypothetical protein
MLHQAPSIVSGSEREVEMRGGEWGSEGEFRVEQQGRGQEWLPWFFVGALASQCRAGWVYDERVPEHDKVCGGGASPMDRSNGIVEWDSV